MIIVGDASSRIVNRKSQTRAEPRRLARNQTDSLIIGNDTILNKSRKRRAELMRLAWNQIDSVIFVDDTSVNGRRQTRAESKKGLVQNCTVSDSRKTRAEPRRRARNQIDSMIVILDHDVSILNQSRKRRAESKKMLAQNQIDSVIVVDDTIVSASRKTRAEPRRLARNQIDSMIVIDPDDMILNRIDSMIVSDAGERLEIVKGDADTIVSRTRHTRAESKRHTRNRIDSVIVIERDDTIDNRGWTRAESKRLEIVEGDADTTIVNRTRQTRADPRRLAWNRIDSQSK
jgi:hypothetical protein